MTIVYTILIFGVIIFIHELGHFVVARLCGVKVTEFAIGMGPAIFKYQGKETCYALRLFPIGGYAAMDGDASETDKRGTYSEASVTKRVLICAAGAFMNLVLGFLIIGFSLVGNEYYASTTIEKFREGAVTNQQLKEGDKIVKMNKTTIFTDRDIVFEATKDEDAKFDITVIRDNKRVKLNDVQFDFKEVEGEERVIFLDFYVKRIEKSFFGGISIAFKETISLARNSWASIGDLIVGKVKLNDLSGPVGVGQIIGEAAKVGVKTIFSITAFISISIGMFNLLPFPALDGGRIIIYIVEAIRRKPIPQKVEAYINASGLILLFGLMIIITLKDIIKLF